jgi:hypothetical protein
MGTWNSFPGGKGGRGVMMTTHPLLVLRLEREGLYLLSPKAPFVVLSESTFYKSIIRTDFQDI